MIVAVAAIVGAYLGLLYVAWLATSSWLSFAAGATAVFATFAVVIVRDRLRFYRARLAYAPPRVTVHRLQKRAKADLAATRRNQKLRVIAGGKS